MAEFLFAVIYRTTTILKTQKVTLLLVDFNLYILLLIADCLSDRRQSGYFDERAGR